MVVLDHSNSSSDVLLVKKRGRKSKKELENLQKKQDENQDNIVVSIEDTIDSNMNEIEMESILNLDDNSNDLNTVNSNTIFLSKDNLLNTNNEPTIKKRGRKPKGGKIIQQITPLTPIKENKPNIILHLKCSLNDLNTFSLLNSNIQSFNFSSNKNEESYEILSNNDFLNGSHVSSNNINNININNSHISSSHINSSNISSNHSMNNNIYENDYDDDNDAKYKENDIREVWKKLKQLEHNLHINNINGKKAACFWCTCEFDNPSVYIPKHFIKETYHVYGCFCSPECATAYLMDENIDSSVKFERYHLLNHIYCKIYDYKKNIKPAPNPYYVLDKYYGNLSIQEYRSLLKNERLFLVVDKPLTRILPELHEDNDDFIINNKIIPSNSYQIKKKLVKKQQNKSSILNENFGLQ